jgi:hypothetical protein
MPQRIIVSSRSSPTLRITGAWIVRRHAGHRRQVADIAVDDAEQRDDGGLICGDAVEIAHALCGLTLLKVR